MPRKPRCYATDETRAKMSKSQLGKHNTIEHNIHISEGLKRLRTRFKWTNIQVFDKNRNPVFGRYDKLCNAVKEVFNINDDTKCKILAHCISHKINKNATYKRYYWVGELNSLYDKKVMYTNVYGKSITGEMIGPFRNPKEAARYSRVRYASKIISSIVSGACERGYQWYGTIKN